MGRSQPAIEGPQSPKRCRTRRKGTSTDEQTERPNRLRSRNFWTGSNGEWWEKWRRCNATVQKSIGQGVGPLDTNEMQMTNRQVRFKSSTLAASDRTFFFLSGLGLQVRMKSVLQKVSKGQSKLYLHLNLNWKQYFSVIQSDMECVCVCATQCIFTFQMAPKSKTTNFSLVWILV